MLLKLLLSYLPPVLVSLPPAPVPPALHAAADFTREFATVNTVSKLLHNPAMHSANGSELQVISFEAPPAIAQEPAKRFLIQGGLHGNEQEASHLVLWLARRFAHGESPLNQLSAQGIAFDFLPFANPDGDAEGTRYNQRGVNLNRNFGVLWGMTKENPGAARFSEPETQAISALFANRHYAAAVDVHGYVNWIVSPSAPEVIKAYGYSVNKERATDYRRWALALKDEMQMLPGYQLKSGAILGDGGAFEDWAFWSQGTFAYCLELETPFRYAPSYRGLLETHGATADHQQIDLFKRYEMFIYRTFAQAAALKKLPVTTDKLAVEP